MILKTKRLMLVPMEMQYLETAFAYAGDPETTRLMVYLPNDDIEETAEFIRAAEAEARKPEPGFYELAVLYNGLHIGGISLYMEHGGAEIGWIIHKDYQRQGFAYEAAAALIRFAVSERGIRHFIAHCDTENIPSRRVMEKLGMTLTEEHGGRKNRLSDAPRREYVFELDVN